MLTEKEKHGISELLHRMSSRDLTSIAQTVTSRLIIPETSGEAISAIILHTDRPTDLLKRRKIKKEFLLKYLNAKRVPLDASADKGNLVSSILQLWGSDSSQNMAFGSSSSLILAGAGVGVGEEDSLPEAPAPSRNTSYSSLHSLDYGPPTSQKHLPLNIDAVTSGLARTKSSGGCDDKSSIHSIPFPLRRSESANSFTMDDEDDDLEPILRNSSTCQPTSPSASAMPLSCDPLRGREPMPAHPLSSSYQPSSIFSSGVQAPTFSLHNRVSQSLTPTPPPILSSSFTSSAVPLAVPSSSSSSPLSGINKPNGFCGYSSNIPPSTTTAANILLSSSAPSSFDPSSFFPEHGTNTVGNPHHLHSPTSNPSNSGQQVNEMADNFVKWFYELINSTFYSSEGNEFGPQHFWTDASAKISLHQGPTSSSSQHSSGSSSLSSTPTAMSVLKETHVNDSGNNSETICVQENGKQVAEALKHVVDQYRITYNPNMTRDGITGFVDPSGLALITACGTLHNTVTSSVCGTFQQQFGLIRDPSLGNNWKIKFTYANLVSKEQVSQQPTLQHPHPASSLLQHSSFPFSTQLQYQQAQQPQPSFLNFNMTSSDANTPFVSSGESGASSSASSTSDAFPSSTSSAMAIS